MVLGEMQAGEEGQLFPVRAICEKLGVPFDVVSKAMQGMNHAGILKSVQGKYGGYQVITGTLTLGVLIAFISYLGIMRFPITILAANTSLISQANGSGV